jgi:hypothetical protein
MPNFSIKLVRRNAMGNPVQGQYVTFETDSAAELAEFYEKTTISNRPGKRHDQVAGKKNQKRNQRRTVTHDAQLSGSVEGK